MVYSLLHIYETAWQSMALPGTNAETPIDSHRHDGSLWKPRSILSYPEGHFNPPSDLTLTKPQRNQGLGGGAGSRSRTGTPSLAADFE